MFQEPADWDIGNCFRVPSFPYNSRRTSPRMSALHSFPEAGRDTKQTMLFSKSTVRLGARSYRSSEITAARASRRSITTAGLPQSIASRGSTSRCRQPVLLLNSKVEQKALYDDTGPISVQQLYTIYAA